MGSPGQIFVLPLYKEFSMLSRGMPGGHIPLFSQLDIIASYRIVSRLKRVEQVTLPCALVARRRRRRADTGSPGAILCSQWLNLKKRLPAIIDHYSCRDKEAYFIWRSP